jgi:cell division protein FtsL
MSTVRVSRSETVRPLPERTEERQRHLRVVNRSQRRRFRLTPKTGVTLTVLGFGALFGVAVSHALLIEGQLRLDRLDQQVAEEQARYERLRLDVAGLESPERILADAQEMGMVPPEEVTWLTPDQAADPAAADPAADPAADSTATTNWEDVKPYLGTNP